LISSCQGHEKRPTRLPPLSTVQTTPELRALTQPADRKDPWWCYVESPRVSALRSRSQSGPPFHEGRHDQHHADPSHPGGCAPGIPVDLLRELCPLALQEACLPKKRWVLPLLGPCGLARQIIRRLLCRGPLAGAPTPTLIQASLSTRTIHHGQTCS
jgi:hypothetical protein